MNRALLLLIPLALAACQQQDPSKATAPPVKADANSSTGPASIGDFSKPMTALGTEPFWSLTVDGTRMKLTRPDKPDLLAEAPGAAIQPGRATWVAKAADGQQITVVLYASNCSDGMSDRSYVFTAEVTMINETLRGCAYRTADKPKEGG